MHLPFFEKRIRQYIGISYSILYTRDMEKDIGKIRKQYKKDEWIRCFCYQSVRGNRKKRTLIDICP